MEMVPPEVDLWEFCLFLMNTLWTKLTVKGKHMQSVQSSQSSLSGRAKTIKNKISNSSISHKPIDCLTCHFVKSIAPLKEALETTLIF